MSLLLRKAWLFDTMGFFVAFFTISPIWMSLSHFPLLFTYLHCFCDFFAFFFWSILWSPCWTVGLDFFAFTINILISYMVLNKSLSIFTNPNYTHRLLNHKFFICPFILAQKWFWLSCTRLSLTFSIWKVVLQVTKCHLILHQIFVIQILSSSISHCLIFPYLVQYS